MNLSAGRQVKRMMIRIVLNQNLVMKIILFDYLVKVYLHPNTYQQVCDHCKFFIDTC
jgi:hypothetical protein